MFVKIDVTRDDINLGSRGSYRHCAISRAINRKLKDGYYAVSEPDELFVCKNNKYGEVFSYKPKSEKIKLFIFDYDEDKHVDPFSFSLQIKKDVAGIFKV